MEQNQPNQQQTQQNQDLFREYQGDILAQKVIQNCRKAGMKDEDILEALTCLY